MQNLHVKLIEVLTNAGFMPQHWRADDTLRGAAVDVGELSAHMEKIYNDPDYRAAVFREALMIVIDGSGTVTYAPRDVAMQMDLWCHWKNEHQTRWYIVTSMKGKILFVSATYSGKIDDATALLHTKFYEWWRRTFSSSPVTVNGRSVTPTLAGDKGYFSVDAAQMPGARIAFTESAALQNVDDDVSLGRTRAARIRKFVERNPSAILTSRLATHRCVVERVIGAMKRLSKFVSGPIYAVQNDTPLASTLLIVAALVNRRFAENNNIFVRDN